MANFNKLQDQIDALRNAVDRAERNINKLDEQGRIPEHETFESLRDDAMELDKRVERLTRNLCTAAIEAEATMEAEADKKIGGDGPPGLKSKFLI